MERALRSTVVESALSGVLIPSTPDRKRDQFSGEEVRNGMRGVRGVWVRQAGEGGTVTRLNIVLRCLICYQQWSESGRCRQVESCGGGGVPSLRTQILFFFSSLFSGSSLFVAVFQVSAFCLCDI